MHTIDSQERFCDDPGFVKVDMNLGWHCAGYRDGPINVFQRPLKLSKIEDGSQSQTREREYLQKLEYIHGCGLITGCGGR